MRYISARRKKDDPRTYSFSEAVLMGFADDGGMLLPETIPIIEDDELGMETLRKWATLDYPHLVFEILKKFIPKTEIPEEDLKKVILGSFSGKFDVEGVVQLVEMESFHILELFHGPTLAFKDLGLQVLGSVLEYILKRDNSHLNILVGTSGDTGPSAIEAVSGKSGINIFVMYPLGRVSRAQEYQMISVEEENCDIVSVEGTSDDIDIVLKGCFGDAKFRKDMNLGSINSINICRILVQIVHFLWTSLRLGLHEDDKREIHFYVPSGACGHLTAGLIARKMLGPKGNSMYLVAATNSNSFVETFANQGELKKQEEVHKTVSPAMDISIPYNIERILYYLCDGDSQQVDQIMAVFEANGHSCISDPIMKSLFSQFGIRAISFSDKDTLKSLREMYEEESYLACPHTCVGICAAKNDLRKTSWSENAIAVVNATASPAKFEEAVVAAISDFNGLYDYHQYGKDLWCELQENQAYTRSSPITHYRADENWTEMMKDLIRKRNEAYV